MKNLFVILTFITFSLSLNAQLLWEITGNGLGKPSYIFGTHHMASIDICNNIKGFDNALASCTDVYVEIKKDNMTPEKTQSAITKYGISAADSTISKLLSVQELAQLNGLLEKYTHQPDMAAQFNVFKPAMVSMTLELLRSASEFPEFNPATQLDIQIQNRAEELGKKLHEFETLDYQLNILFGTPIKYQIEMLKESITHDKEMGELSIKIAELYKKQDINSILKMMESESYGSSPEEMEIMIYSRNRNWVEKLKSALPQKSILVCVGAGHLPGNKGIIKLLQQAGYKVKPVK